jgi:thioredoxin 1
MLVTDLRADDGASAAAAKPALPRLVDLGADKCIPCRMMAPLLAELAKEYAGQLDVVFIDVWKNREEGPRYGIRVIPTQILYDAKGKELFRHEGFYAKKDILAKWRELGVELKEPTATKAN